MRMKYVSHVMFFVVLMIVFGLYYSSSMSYQAQTLVPKLEQWLINKPLYGFFSLFRFTYSNVEISVQTMGYVHFIEFLIRKFAHLSIFMLLGISLYLYLYPYMTQRLIHMIVTFFLVFGYASFDELHQTFQPNRSGMIEDVILDSVGGLIGIVITALLVKFLMKIKILKE